MQTRFTAAQLADPDTADAESILRACVHCGFCQATCPTYVLLGDELDSPRGRIYLMKEILETGAAPTRKVVGHIDRCLSCLSCMTTCPSGVNYMHLVDLARRRIEETFRRPVAERVLRRALAAILPSPRRFRAALGLARLAGPLARRFPGALGRMARLAPRGARGSPVSSAGEVHRAAGVRRYRVALLAGCVQQVMDAGINAATIGLLTRNGCEVVLARGAGCCGAIAHHLGDHAGALAAARANLTAWRAEIDGAGLDAVVVNASGCGVMVRDYAHLFRDHRDSARDAARISDLACDISEFLVRIGVPRSDSPPRGIKVAYHSACALQHGQKIHAAPVDLLRRAGFEVVLPQEGHLCCGSAGTYNILQPALADALGARKAGHLEALAPDVIAAGNIGCMSQIAKATRLPVVHTVALLDWADGGPRPVELAETDDGRG